MTRPKTQQRYGDLKPMKVALSENIRKASVIDLNRALADTIDVTAISTVLFALNHSGYAEKSALLQDIQMLIQTGERPPDKRVPILERVKTDRGDYWRYPRSGR